jgi:hypothetical protein
MRCFASTTAAPLLFIYLLSLAPGVLTSLPSLSCWCKTSSSGCGPGSSCELWLWPGLSCWRSTGSGACSDSWSRSCFAPARARALAQLQLLAQAQGFGYHLPSLPSAKLLALASRWPLLLALARRWPLLLAPTSRRSIPARQFASTSPQSSWTIETKVNTSGDRHTRLQMPHIIVGIGMGYIDTCKKAPAFAVNPCA